jgi:hypothetical protein
MTTTNGKFRVELWGSKPGLNDDCWVGDVYDTQEEAQGVFDKAVSTLEDGDAFWDCIAAHDGFEVAYVVIDGPGVYREHRLDVTEPEPERDDLWENEFAMQQGMAFGCQGYNDAMGY